MDRAVAPHVPASNNFRDGLGERRRVNHTTGDTMELLCIRRELTTVPSFEFALRERASRLAGFRHDAFARVRSIDRLSEPSAALAVVSDFTRGVRLSHLLTPNERRRVTIDINAAQRLIRQVVAAVAALHESARDLAHGAIGPERIIVTPNAGAVVVEYVLGAALEQLRYSPERYWKLLRIALPPAAGAAKFDHRTDVMQLGMVALALVLGRQLTDDEHPEHLGDLLASAKAVSARGGDEPLSYGLREWIGCALQLDSRRSFASASDARAALERMLPGAISNEAGAKRESKITIVGDRIDAARPAVVALQPKIAPVPARPAAAVLPQQVVAAPPSIPPAGAPESNSVRHRPDSGGTAATQKAAISFPDPKPAAAAREAPMAPSVPALKATVASSTPLGLGPRLLSPPMTETAAVDLNAGAFDDEAVEEDGAEQSAREKKPWMRLIVAAVVVAGLVAAATYAGRSFFSTSDHAVRTGTLSVASNPAGAQVFVDRQGRGTTPVTLTLQPGPHSIEFRGIGEPRTVNVNVAAGTQTSQYVELATPAAASSGQLQVRTEPAGAQVTVDGVARGKSPTLVEGLTPGEHDVALASNFGTVKQTVTVEASTTASLVVPLAAPPAAPLSGWVAVAAPVDVEIRERGKVLGTSQSERIMVTAGRHELEVVNDTLGYRATAVVQVLPGKVAPVRIEWPKGTVSLNAEPWAEVWIDGQKAGDTPIGNLSLPIGPHEIVFRHPELGEQRHAVSVSLKSPARVSVDMRKQQ
jgi:PEGA domain